MGSLRQAPGSYSGFCPPTTRRDQYHAPMREAGKPALIGVIANPTSGRDIRRLVASAAHSTLQDKVSIVRRCVIGAIESGAREFVFLPEPHEIPRRATQTLAAFGPDGGCTQRVLDFAPRHRESDTTLAAASMRALGCRALIVLGGDGTNRAVAKGWPDAPLIPLSTGTNNVFPYYAEPTIAGAVAGLLATGRLPLDAVARPAKRIEVEIEGEPGDLALVDALALDGRLVGSLMLFEPDALRAAVLARAEPAGVGLSAVGGLLRPCGADDDSGLALVFSPPGDSPAECVHAPMAPGHYEEIGIRAWRVLEPGESLEVEGPCLLAFDGERKRVLASGKKARFTLDRAGPRVVDLGLGMKLAAEDSLFTSRANA